MTLSSLPPFPDLPPKGGGESGKRLGPLRTDAGNGQNEGTELRAPRLDLKALAARVLAEAAEVEGAGLVSESRRNPSESGAETSGISPESCPPSTPLLGRQLLSQLAAHGALTSKELSLRLGRPRDHDLYDALARLLDARQIATDDRTRAFYLLRQ